MNPRAIDTVPLAVAHRVQLLRDLPTGELLIHEIYRSLQGESTFAGLPCVFVRTAVCDSRCTWCDTPHAFTQGERMSRTAVLAKALSFDTPLVELTGGEPLLQPDVPVLMAELCEAGKTVLIETSGAHDVGVIDRRVHIIMDLKCPESGECDRNRWANLGLLKPTDQIKLVIASRRDWEWAERVVREHRLDERFAVLVSAVFGAVGLRDLSDWILASRLNVRMQLQMHKYIWDPKARGV
ncbi:MAG: radical SAM protein [Fimbriiglobus sp.]|jgi:7-carboxy-7-deazaguanine synthase|nr:radical SAM protein [Fimbriiglobus sp.]